MIRTKFSGWAGVEMLTTTPYNDKLVLPQELSLSSLQSGQNYYSWTKSPRVRGETLGTHRGRN
jgi:hypothetical protein